MSIITQATETIQRLASRHDACLVAFSGGKDSLVVLDMARRSFKRVVGLFMYFVPCLQCDADRLKIAETWGVPILQYPHFDFLEAMRNGVYCWGGHEHKKIPKLTRQEIYDLARLDTGIEIVLTGIKRSDSMSRRSKLKEMTSKKVFHPIAEWKDFDVMGYCGLHKIPLPKTPTGAKSSGVDLQAKSLLFLRESYPDDYDRLIQWFPFAATVIERERWFYGYAEPFCEVHAAQGSSIGTEVGTVQPAQVEREGQGEAEKEP